VVGDSVGRSVQGHATTATTTMDAMVHHTRAVAAGHGDSLLIGNLMSYATPKATLRNATRLMLAGAHMVKLEGSGGWVVRGNGRIPRQEGHPRLHPRRPDAPVLPPARGLPDPGPGSRGGRTAPARGQGPAGGRGGPPGDGRGDPRTSHTTATRIFIWGVIWIIRAARGRIPAGRWHPRCCQGRGASPGARRRGW
jgi:hypothetical protein